jgi:hypothetical protein
MVSKYSAEQAAAIIAEAKINIRGRRQLSPGADAEDWGAVAPAPQPAAAAPIEGHGPRDPVAAANPWSERRLRERAELEIADMERRVAEAERRQVEREHRAARASGDTVTALRNDVIELAAASRSAVEALLARIEQQDMEIAALRTRVEQSERRKAATKAKKPATLPAFLTPRLSS